MHGTGNDYIYINCFEEKINNPQKLAEYLSNRHFGIGGDGIVLIMPSEKADFRMRMFNADGSEGNMCGNASRCIGKYVYDNGLTDKTELTLETNSGIKKLTLFPENGKVRTVLVDMGKAVLTPSELPMKAEGDSFINKPIDVWGETMNITAISMGNPHAVVFVDDTDNLDLERTGPLFENHAIFPERVNTEFVKVVDRDTLKMRVWERGAGETLACGTGACAAAMAAVLNGYSDYDKEITMKLRGGDLYITCQKYGTILMRGSAETVFTGEINI